MGDGTKLSAQSNPAQRVDGVDTRQAGKRTQSLRSLLQPQPVDFVPVPALESDDWLQAETGSGRAASALHAYVLRATEIGLEIQRNRGALAPVAVQTRRPETTVQPRAVQQPTAAAAQPRRVSLPPPPPPARKPTPGAGLPDLGAPELVRPGPSAATIGRQRAREQSQRLSTTTAGHAPVREVRAPAQPAAAASAPLDRELQEVRQQLQQAFVRVRQQQAMLSQAEQRARSAEEWIKRYSQVNPPAQLTRRARLLRHASALLVFFVAAFVVGGYISLLGPVRKRVLMHEAALRELGASQQQLTHQNQALLQQLSQSSSAAP